MFAHGVRVRGTFHWLLVYYGCSTLKPAPSVCSAPMPNPKLNNYLRVCRKRAGLTQREVAFLLGLKARGAISELEKRHRVPLLRTAVTLEAIFGVPVSDLFPGMRLAVDADVEHRIEEFAKLLKAKADKKSDAYKTARKLAWLRERRAVTTLHGPQPQTSPRP